MPHSSSDAIDDCNNWLVTAYGAQSERQQLTRAIFLDRDGVLIEDQNYLGHAEGIQLLPGITDLPKYTMTFRIIVVTNQSGIARGYFSDEDLMMFHLHLLNVFGDLGTQIDAVYHCPHHDKGTIAFYRKACPFRKPNPGMIIRAMAAFGLRSDTSYMIGDRKSDMEAGKTAGLQTILISNKPQKLQEKNSIATNLREALRLIPL